MSGHTVLVYFTSEERTAGLIDVAGHLARRGVNRVIGVYAGAQFVVYPSMGYAIPPEIYQGHAEHDAATAAAIERVFLDAMAAESVNAEWRFLAPDAAPVMERLLPHVRSSDLVVAEILRSVSRDDTFARIGEQLALDAGRPVLLVPEAAQAENALRQVLVAWDGSREAARATFDALPLLLAAEGVHLVRVDEAFEGGRPDDIPAAEIAATLAHHGVVCTADRITPQDETTAEALLRRAAEVGADLIVMGAYGHSRLREIVFGGATRRLLHDTKVPLLLSH